MNSVAVAVALTAPAYATAAVLTFDDLSGSAYFSGQYRGFTFGVSPTTGNGGSWYWSDSAGPGGETLYTSPSTSISTEVAFDAQGNSIYGDSLAVSSSNAFVFEGASFIALADIMVRYKLYSAGQLVFESDYFDLGYNAPSYLATGYAGAIDAFAVEGYQGYFAMDDLVYNAVPEPLTLSLFLLAGAAGCLARRSRGQTRT
jgi:hypothetical protein